MMTHHGTVTGSGVPKIAGLTESGFLHALDILQIVISDSRENPKWQEQSCRTWDENQRSMFISSEAQRRFVQNFSLVSAGASHVNAIQLYMCIASLRFFQHSRRVPLGKKSTPGVSPAPGRSVCTNFRGTMKLYVVSSSLKKSPESIDDTLKISDLAANVWTYQ